MQRGQTKTEKILCSATEMPLRCIGLYGDGVMMMMMMSQNLSGKPLAHCVIVWCEQKRHCWGGRVHGKESVHATKQQTHKLNRQ